ncbi:hypothetical protein [Diaphorobacter sp.]|uniref:hypothetical protein n=1 Tax=Diaphorobacter sp. TaxID=1934310 RepID=UPI0028ACB61A|nr:hypothetical protein [Diaphorobacter sp.]
MKKKLLAISLLLGTSLAQAFAPQAGTWVITAENNGQPGRGFGLDVQNSTLVMQMYGYESSGSPTFYLTAGALTNNQYAGPLMQYRNGRFFGSGERNGQEAGNAGTVKMRFVSGTQGFITFPGEAEKEIARFSFAYPAGPDGLKGIWLFSPLDTVTPSADFFRLEQNIGATDGGNGLVMSTNGRVGCEHQTKGTLAGSVLCVRLNASGKLDRGYQMVYSVNEGEGLLLTPSGEPTALAVMRRLGNSTDVGTGVLHKSSDAQELSEAAAQNFRGEFEAFKASTQND